MAQNLLGPENLDKTSTQQARDFVYEFHLADLAIAFSRQDVYCLDMDTTYTVRKCKKGSMPYDAWCNLSLSGVQDLQCEDSRRSLPIARLLG